MAVDQFCLKWNNFQSSIITAFESLQTTEDLADVTLTCERYNIKAHKIILSACSPYFRSIFKENPCPHPIVILKDVLYVDLLAVLNFMYHGEVLISKDQLKSFLQTAEILQVSGLIGTTDFALKTLSTSPKPPSKVVKTNRLPESFEPVMKKTKTSPKLKPNKTPIITSDGTTSSILPPVDNGAENTSAICLKEIKTELVDEENDSNSTEAVEATKNIEQQGSILEAVLEMKDQPSILERSLTTAVKSPSAVTYPMDHVTVLHTVSEHLKPTFLAKKSPDPAESVVIKPPDPNQMLDLSNDDICNIKIEEQSPKSVEVCIDAIPIAQNESLQPPGLKTINDIQPHHSSQCGQCPHCGKVYSNQSALKYHVRLVHSDLTNMYCCHLCPESFDYREGYKKHMVEAHSIRN